MSDVISRVLLDLPDSRCPASLNTCRRKKLHAGMTATYACRHAAVVYPPLKKRRHHDVGVDAIVVSASVVVGAGATGSSGSTGLGAISWSTCFSYASALPLNSPRERRRLPFSFSSFSIRVTFVRACSLSARSSPRSSAASSRSLDQSYVVAGNDGDMPASPLPL